ncbi:hypothetical protein [Pseudoalteromonas sp. MMG005]|uniref:hypothetical protein n=1 Tax=Pseudoalteromonas sp. MMG005 TaxID=2822682 RepID=UPI001B3A6016|nr:hypothetical protein [Pseudoalteromonas sp. MMG005]MBQ4848441.1 hypothetical protein [Pseudoalteromonas sp. MMG005]
MKYYLLTIVFLLLSENTYAYNVVKLNKCISSEKYGGTIIYENCNGGNALVIDLHYSELSVSDVMELMKKGSYDISSLQGKLEDDVVAAIYSVLLIEKKFEYFFATQNAVTVLLKDKGLVIFERSEGTWRQLSIASME